MGKRVEKEHLVYYDFEQGSDEWIQIRNKFITASAIGNIIKGSESAEYRNLLAEKASNGEYRSFFGNTATKWGHKYEPVANMIFEYRNPGTEIYEYGLIYNPKYPLLGVSPDGITNKNEMLEIKCPYSRKIDGKIKREYEHQIQQQLLVCEHEICNFLECKFIEVNESEFWEKFDNLSERGVIIQSMEMENDKKYNLYSPIQLSFNKCDFRDWLNYRLEDIEIENSKLIKITYWVLEIYNCQKVKRNEEWYSLHQQVIEKFWADVEMARVNGWKNLVKKKSTIFDLPNDCLL